MPDSLHDLSARCSAFAQARAWDQFHTPKNLAMALAGETGEVVAELQWSEPGEPLDDDLRARLGAEAADVLIYLVRFADVAGIDLIAAAEEKLALNEQRYPLERSYGSSAKYTAYDATR